MKCILVDKFWDNIPTPIWSASPSNGIDSALHCRVCRVLLLPHISGRPPHLLDCLPPNFLHQFSASPITSLLPPQPHFTTYVWQAKTIDTVVGGGRKVNEGLVGQKCSSQTENVNPFSNSSKSARIRGTSRQAVCVYFYLLFSNWIFSLAFHIFLLTFWIHQPTLWIYLLTFWIFLLTLLIFLLTFWIHQLTFWIFLPTFWIFRFPFKYAYLLSEHSDQQSAVVHPVTEGSLRAKWSSYLLPDTLGWACLGAFIFWVW